MDIQENMRNRIMDSKNKCPEIELMDYQKEFLANCIEQLKLKLSSGDVIEPAVFYGEQIIWNPKPEKD